MLAGAGAGGMGVGVGRGGGAGPGGLVLGASREGFASVGTASLSTNESVSVTYPVGKGRSPQIMVLWRAGRSVLGSPCRLGDHSSKTT